jgi:phosphoglycolate phosphatase (TIGR01487 family)
MKRYFGGGLMIKAVATDVDGTLTDCEDYICVEAITAIRELEAKEIRVILCSGNALCVVKALARYMGCTGPTVSENGAVVEYKAKMRILGEKGAARRVVQELKDAYGSEIRESWSNKYRFVDMAIQWSRDIKELRTIVKKFKGMKLIDSGFAYHILDERIDKGAGLLQTMKLLKLQPSEVAGVGDSITDLEMLRVCGFKGVVANGDPRIKKIANYVAKEEFGKGFAEIARHIISKN